MVSFYRQRGLIPGRVRPPRVSYVGVPMVDLTSGGTFSRSSDKTVLTSATTVTTVSDNVRAFENRGDGNGSLLTLGGARTTLVGYSRDLASWGQNANNNGYSNAGTSPDGTGNAGRVVKNATPFTGPYLAANIGAVKAGVISLWAKNNGGGTSTRLRFSFGTGIALPITLTNTWTRYSLYATFTGAANDFLSFDHRANIPNAGDPAISVATDFFVYGVMLEANVKFAATTIASTSGTSTTLSADTLTYAGGQYVAAMLTVPWQVDFMPRYALGADLTTGDTFYLASYGDANNGVYIDDAGKVTVKVGGATKVQSSAITCSKFQKLTVAVRPADGAIVVSGATSGNGTYTGTSYAFPASPLRIGGIYGGNGEAFGSFGTPVGIA